VTADPRPFRPRRPRGGLGISEAVVSVFVVSFALVAALHAAGGAIVAQAKGAERARARHLADALLAEVASLDYEDPTAVLKLFGPEAGELLSSKANYNDVDDFNGWAESPPRDRTNVALPNLSGWRREVAVARVNPLDPTQAAATDTGAKRVTVTVKRNGVTLATRTTIRTKP